MGPPPNPGLRQPPPLPIVAGIAFVCDGSAHNVSVERVEEGAVLLRIAVTGESEHTYFVRLSAPLGHYI